MAFGGQRGFLTGSATSIGTSFPIATGTPFAVKNGDLIYVVLSEQVASGNGTATTVTDNLGNTYTATQAQLGSGTVACRAWYSIVSRAGTVSTVTIVANGSTNNACGIAVGVEGAFKALIDRNPTNITTDITSPFTCPLTGTLAKAISVVVAWGGANFSTVFAATSPNILVTNATTAALAMTAIGIQTTSVTTSISPAFTAAANPSNCVLGVSSFPQEDISPFNVVRMDWTLPQQATRPITMRGWASPSIVPAVTIVTVPGPISISAPRSAIYPTSMRGWVTAAIQSSVAPGIVAIPGAITFTSPRAAHYPRDMRGWITAGQQKSPPPPIPLDFRLPASAAYPTSLRGWISAAVQAAAVKPTAQYDWPLPKPSAYPASMRGWVTSAARGATGTPVTYYDWPLPRQAFYPTNMRGWVGRVIAPVSVAVTAGPFNQYDWPLPQRPNYPASMRGFIDYDSFDFTKLPFNQYDWPLPKRLDYPISLRGFIGYDSFFFTTGVAATPGAITFTPPRAAYYPIGLRGWISRLPDVSFKMGANQYDWPLPKPRYYSISLRGWVTAGQQTSPVVNLTTYLRYDWPLPLRPNYPINMRGWIGRVIAPISAPVTAAPFNQYDWPLPRAPTYPTSLRGFIDYDSFDVTRPFAQYDWPLPSRPYYPVNMRGWVGRIIAPISVVTVGTPFAQYDWPLPQQASYSVSQRGWISRLPNITFNQGANQYDWPLPKAPYYPIGLRGQIGTLNPGAVSYQMGANQYDWALSSWSIRQHLQGVPDIELLINNTLPLQNPPPPVINVEHHDMPFFATPGMLKTW